MTGEIDQVDNVVRFIFDDEDAAWNSSIKYCCEQVNIKKKILWKYLLKYLSLTILLKKSHQSILSGMRRIMPSLAQKLKIFKFRAPIHCHCKSEKFKNKLFTQNNQILFI